MSNIDKRYKRRLVVFCMVVLVAVLASIQTLVFFIGQEDIQDQLEASAKGIAAAVGQMMSIDVTDYKTFLMTMDRESDYYRDMRRRLTQIKRESSTIKYIYTEKRVDEKTTEFLLDAEPLNEKDYSPPGDKDINNLEKESVFRDNAIVGRRSSSGDKWGKLISAYAPIVDTDHRSNVGLVGVDMDGQHLYRQFHRINRAMTLANLVIIGLSLLSLLKFADSILDRMLRDKLTGAFAKRHFDGLLDDGIKRSIKRRSGLALVMLDLDHFKAVNDTYGHVFGDRVLVSVSKAIKGSIRPDDTFVRVGGEEFAVIMANMAPDNAVEAAERMRRAVENAPVFNEEFNAQVKTTISLGVANFTDLSRGAKELVENADKALYEAKVTRNAVALFDATHHQQG